MFNILHYLNKNISSSFQFKLHKILKKTRQIDGHFLVAYILWNKEGELHRFGAIYGTVSIR